MQPQWTQVYLNMDFKDPWQPDTAGMQKSREGQNFQKGLGVTKIPTLTVCPGVWFKFALPPKRYIQVLILSTYECDLIWKQGLCRYHQVK